MPLVDLAEASAGQVVEDFTAQREVAPVDAQSRFPDANHPVDEVVLSDRSLVKAQRRGNTEKPGNGPGSTKGVKV